MISALYWDDTFDKSLFSSSKPFSSFIALVSEHSSADVELFCCWPCDWLDWRQRGWIDHWWLCLPWSWAYAPFLISSRKSKALTYWQSSVHARHKRLPPYSRSSGCTSMKSSESSVPSCIRLLKAFLWLLFTIDLSDRILFNENCILKRHRQHWMARTSNYYEHASGTASEGRMDRFEELVKRGQKGAFQNSCRYIRPIFVFLQSPVLVSLLSGLVRFMSSPSTNPL